MKIASCYFLSLLAPMALVAQTMVPVDPNCCGNDPEGTILEIREVASADVINARRSAAAKSGYQAASISTLTEKVEIRPQEKSFLAGSEFILGARGFVILPKGCVVTAGRGIEVLSEPPVNNQLQDWKNFQRSNPAVLRLLPITEAMLNGDDAALKTITQKINALKTSGVAYVTTLNGSPVSIPSLSTIKS